LTTSTLCDRSLGYLNHQAGLSQGGDAQGGRAGIDIKRADHDPAHPSIDQRLRAGRSPALMRAGFKTHVRGGARRLDTCDIERRALCMGPTGTLVPSLPDD
jgi:hypothetical protein